MLHATKQIQKETKSVYIPTNLVGRNREANVYVLWRHTSQVVILNIFLTSSPWEFVNFGQAGPTNNFPIPSLPGNSPGVTTSPGEVGNGLCMDSGPLAESEAPRPPCWARTRR